MATDATPARNVGYKLASPSGGLDIHPTAHAASSQFLDSPGTIPHLVSEISCCDFHRIGAVKPD